MSWVPSGSAKDDERGDTRTQDRRGSGKKKGIEYLGAGLEKGVEMVDDMSDAQRQGRTHRRKGVRSGSKNVFRSM